MGVPVPVHDAAGDAGEKVTARKLFGGSRGGKTAERGRDAEARTKQENHLKLSEKRGSVNITAIWGRGKRGRFGGMKRITVESS
jgi:hypothetical protein